MENGKKDEASWPETIKSAITTLRNLKVGNECLGAETVHVRKYGTLLQFTFELASHPDWLQPRLPPPPGLIHLWPMIPIPGDSIGGSEVYKCFCRRHHDVYGDCLVHTGKNTGVTNAVWVTGLRDRNVGGRCWL